MNDKWFLGARACFLALRLLQFVTLQRIEPLVRGDWADRKSW